MKRKRLPRALAGTLILSGLAAPAWAQEKGAAEALFRSAREASERGDWITACDRFEESLRLEPAPGTVLNLAQCREKLGQLASAWRLYGEVVQRLPKSDARVAYARDKERELSPDVPRLLLTAPAEGGAYRVTVNAMEVMPATFGVPLPFDPGTLVVRLEADGRDAFEKRLEIEKGQSLSVQLELGPVRVEAGEPAAAPDQGSEQPSSSASSSTRTWGWVSIGTGVAGVGLSVAGFIWAVNESHITNDPTHCPTPGNACDQEGFDASRRGQTAVALGWIGAGVGVAGLGLGTFLLTRPSGEKVGVGVQPVLGGAALSIGGQL